LAVFHSFARSVRTVWRLYSFVANLPVQ
jgi:hypothetical protein